jgi:pilus assembly protein CpaB
LVKSVYYFKYKVCVCPGAKCIPAVAQEVYSLLKLSRKKLSPKMLLLMAAALSFITAILVCLYLRQAQRSMVVAETAVVVAVRDIPARTLLTANMLKLTRVSAGLVLPGARQEIKSLIGTATRRSISAGAQITEDKLAIDGRGMGMSWNLPPGKRAFTIAVNEISGMRGFLQVGDFVDVIGVFDKGAEGKALSRVLLQKARVLAVNRQDGSDSANKDSNKEQGQNKLTSVTLAVSLHDAARLALASAKGQIDLALRPFAAADCDLSEAAIGLKQLTGNFAGFTTEMVSRTAEIPKAPTTAVALPKEGNVAKKSAGVTVIRGTEIDEANREAQ